MNRLKLGLNWWNTTDHLGGLGGIYFELIKKNRKITTCNRLDLETLGSGHIVPKNLPQHRAKRMICPFSYGFVFVSTLSIVFNVI